MKWKRSKGDFVAACLLTLTVKLVFIALAFVITAGLAGGIVWIGAKVLQGMGIL